jgi:hypothetical protein
MIHHKRGWHCQTGQQSRQVRKRRELLVRRGLASLWLPLRDVEEAGRKAGI